MATTIKNIIPSHDEQFLKFLQKSFGNTYVDFFGVLVSTVSLLIIALIFLMYSAIVFISNDCPISDSPISEFNNSQILQLKRPLII